METELRPAHEGEFGSRIEPEREPVAGFAEDDSSPVYFQHQPQPQYHMVQQPLQPQSSSRGLFEDDDRMKYIIPLVAFIIGFFMAKTMNPIIIRST